MKESTPTMGQVQGLKPGNRVEGKIMKKITTEIDKTLEQLIADRREEVVGLQQREAERQQAIEQNGQSRLSRLQESLPGELANALAALQQSHEDQANEAEQQSQDFRQSMMELDRSPEASAVHPGLAQSSLTAESAAVGWITPYHATVHGSDGTVYWQGYNPGNIDARTSASGSGSGLFGTGAGSFTVYVDWWFTYRAPQNRNYSHSIYVPFNGFYIVRADDGFWDSKEAKVRIDLSAVGYQYNFKASSSTNVLDLSDDNINVNDRFDGWRTMYYAQLLGADQAYLRVTAALHVYARGGGSHAQLNFSDGNANFLGVPWIYVI